MYDYLKGEEFGIAILKKIPCKNFKGQNTNVFLCSTIRKDSFFKTDSSVQNFLPTLNNAFCNPRVMEDIFL